MPLGGVGVALHQVERPARVVAVAGHEPQEAVGPLALALERDGEQEVRALPAHAAARAPS